jgi:hypothetical protein
MMEAIEARGVRIAAEAQAAAVARVAERVADAVPGVAVTRDDDGVTLAGPGLGRRMLDEPALRWFGSLVR